MASRPVREYADFHLLDPAQISQGTEAAIVITVGALLRGSYMELEGTPADIARVVNHNIVDLGHSKVARRHLHQQVTSEGSGAWQFYYCLRCFGRLTSVRCASCGRRYQQQGRYLGSKQPTMPRRVAQYLIERGYRPERTRA